MTAKPLSQPSAYFTPGMLILLSVVPVVAGMARLAELALGSKMTEANTRFFAAPLPVALHILAVIPYSLLGAFQFTPALRRRRPGWHRAVGRLLVVLGLVVALTGLWMANFYPWPKGDGEILYLLRIGFGSAMAMAIILAVDAIRRRDFATHGAWMIRGYAIGMGAGTQVLTHIPYFLLVGKPDELTKAVLMGSGWVINAVAAEWIIQSGASGQNSNQRVAAPGTKRRSPDLQRLGNR